MLCCRPRLVLAATALLATATNAAAASSPFLLEAWLASAGVKPAAALFNASSPAWPKGVWPKSCANAMASAKSSFNDKLRHKPRAICAASNVCVSRVRK